MPVTSGEELLANELRHIHGAEKLLSRSLPRLAKLVTSEALQEKLDERLEEGRQILEAVEEELEQLEVSVGRQKNIAAEGLMEDAQQLAEQIEDEDVLDAALIGAIQKVQHYCIASWGTTAAFARAMGQDSLVEAMERALENGRRFDEELTDIAEEEVNPAIFEGEGEEDEEGESQGGEGQGAERQGGERQGAQRGRAKQGGGQEQGGRQSRGGKTQRAQTATKRGGSGRTQERERGSESRQGSGARSSRSQGRESDADLKRREYRDRNGEIRHHTRSYMERQGRK